VPALTESRGLQCCRGDILRGSRGPGREDRAMGAFFYMSDSVLSRASNPEGCDATAEHQKP
jgi:hypothetical protein